MAIRLVTAGLLALLVGVGLGLAVLARQPAPAGGLHSVWCVQQGYPPSLAMPEVVGPGTELSGCPAGEVQVQP